MWIAPKLAFHALDKKMPDSRISVKKFHLYRSSFFEVLQKDHRGRTGRAINS
jgi:hypothetical protein